MLILLLWSKTQELIAVIGSVKYTSYSAQILCLEDAFRGKNEKNWTKCECEELTLVLFHSKFAELQEIEGDVITLVGSFLLDGGGKADLVGT